jgi:tryptophanase
MRANLPNTLGSASNAEKKVMQQRVSPTVEIAKEMFDLLVSAKKDGLANIGGFLVLNDDDLAQDCKNRSLAMVCCVGMVIDWSKRW